MTCINCRTYGQRLQFEFIIFGQELLQVNAQGALQELNTLLSLVVSDQHLGNDRVCLGQLVDIRLEMLDFVQYGQIEQLQQEVLFTWCEAVSEQGQQNRVQEFSHGV